MQVKTVDLTVVQMMKAEPHKVIAKKAGFLQSAVSKHFNGKLTGKENCGM